MHVMDGVWQVDCGHYLSPHTATHSLWASGMGGELEGQKWVKLMGWDRDSLINKSEKKRKQELQRESLNTFHWQTDVHWISEQWLLWEG